MVKRHRSGKAWIPAGRQADQLAEKLMKDVLGVGGRAGKAKAPPRLVTPPVREQIVEALPRNPQDVPVLRREIAEFMASPDGGAKFYTMMIQLGRQPICPQHPPELAGLTLAMCETKRLRDAALWFVDADLCDLVGVAFPSMPPFAVQPHDLPSLSGFVVFAQPIGLLSRELQGVSPGVVEMLLPDRPELAESILDAGVRIVAASWSPMETPGMPAFGPAGAVWFTFYAETNLDRIGGDEARLRAAREIGPPLNPDNECIVGWCPPDVDDADRERWLLPVEPGQTSQWAALVFATFQLAKQQNLTEQDEVQVARPERRRYERAKLAAPDGIRVLRLRRAVRAAQQTAAEGDVRAGRVYRHRWVVSGHWRNVWYPSLKSHRPRWILPYIAGPDGAPLLGGEKVTRLSGGGSLPQ